jgi:hypothetical protein
MNNLQMRHLLKFCRKHELDPHQIDKTLTYSENKKYLKSLVPDFNPESKMDQWKAAEEQYMAEHALSHYLACMLEGKTKSKDVGEVSERRFSLRDMIAIKVK